MDCHILLEVLVSLLGITIHTIGGFSLRGASRSNQRLFQDSPLDQNYGDQINDRLHFIRSLSDAWPDSDFQGHLQTKDDLLREISSLDSTYPSSPSESRGQSVDEKNVDDEKKFDDPENIDLISAMTFRPSSSLTSGGDPNIDDIPSSSKFDLLTLPSKRQQGWYVQYGKRNTGPDKSNPFPNPIQYNYLKSKPNKLTTHTKSTYEKNDWLRKILFGLDLAKDLDKADGGSKMRGIAFELVEKKDDGKASRQPDGLMSSPVLWKRQQGWFTQYGKRGQDSQGSLFS